MPLLAFAAGTTTINFRDGSGSGSLYTHVSTLTAIKGKEERWSFKVVNSENPYSSYRGSWTVTGKPSWLNLTNSNINNAYDISFRGAVPITATNFTLTLKIEIQGQDPITQTISVTIEAPQIQYQYRNSEGRWDWSNETSLSVIKGKYENFDFRTSSELQGIWEVVSGPDWLRNSIDYYNVPRARFYTYGEIPNDAENTTLQLKVTDDSSSVATRTYSITVQTPATPTITTTALASGEVGKDYNANLATSSIYAQWSIASGNLPAGLELTGNGSIYGYPTTVGTSNFTVKSKNITGEQTKNLSITIAAATTSPEFTGFNGCWDEDDVQICEVQEGASTVGFGLDRVATEVKIKSGSLPPGITLKPDPNWANVGYIFSGNLTYVAGNSYTFVVEAKNSHGSSEQTFKFEIIQAEAAPIISNDIWTPEIYAGMVYESYLSLSNWVGATWTVTGLPSGLTYSSPWSGELYITGIPTQAGRFTVTATASNSKGSNSKTFTIDILLPTKPQISTISLPEGRINLPYDEVIDADTEFARWRISSGALPPGLTLEDYDGGGASWIEGIPTAVGNYTFTVEAKNANGTSTKQFTIIVKNPVTPTITTTTLPQAQKGPYYYAELKAADEALWSKTSGSLPSGLTLNSSGYIHGNVTATAGTYTFTVKAQNDAGNDTKELSIVVENPPIPTITTSPSLSGKVGQDLSIRFEANQYVASWSVANSNLPTTLSISSSNGVLTGTPSVAGTYTFKLTAVNAGGSSEQVQFTLTITAPVVPVITTASLPNGAIGQNYDQDLSASDYATWSIASGNLPPGLSLSSHGSIYGIPITAGTYSFTLKATNITGSGTKLLSITITGSSNSGGNVVPGNDNGCISYPCTSTPPKTSPVSPTKVAISNISVHTIGSVIVLENLPNNTKVDVYNLKGKQIYSTNSENSKILKILVQTKGMYVVKAANQTLRAVVK